MNRPGRLALALLAWLMVTAVMVIVMFMLAWVVAGPHAGMLPRPLEIAVWILGYAVILIVPLVVAVFVYRKLSLGSAHPKQTPA